MRLALIAPAYLPGADSESARRAERRVRALLGKGHTLHLIAPALSRTRSREVLGALHIHRVPGASPIVTRERLRLTFSTQAARLACEFHERGEVEAVDATFDPISGALLSTLRGAGQAPIRINLDGESIPSPPVKGLQAGVDLASVLADGRRDASERLIAWRAARDALAVHNAKEMAPC